MRFKNLYLIGKVSKNISFAQTLLTKIVNKSMLIKQKLLRYNDLKVLNRINILTNVYFYQRALFVDERTFLS